MARTEPNSNIYNELDLDLVRDFIMQYPEFIANDDELLNRIASDNHSGNIVSIKDLARNRLIRENNMVKSRFKEIVDNARKNYEAQIRVQEAIIAVLDAKSAEDLRDRLSGHVAFSLAADACVLAISNTGAADEVLDKMGSIIERMVPVERPVSIGAVDRARGWLYGDEADYVRSEALARIEFGANRRVALLAIASSDIDCFREDMGHELVVYFAKVIERVLTNLEACGQI